MPKLDKSQAKAVESAEKMEGGSFLLEPGRYAARLRSVVEEDEKHFKDRQANASETIFPYWEIQFDGIHDEDGHQRPGRQFRNMSLSPKAAGFLKGFFEAFGYTPDSDTDEMLGEWCVIYVSQEPQAQGKNAGTMRNQIDRFAEFDPAEWDFDPAAVPTKADSGGFAAEGKKASGDDF